MTQQTLERPTTEKAPGKDDAYWKIAAQFPALNAHDRCDSYTWSVNKTGGKERVGCRAQAFIRAVLPSGQDLLFCGHHLGEQTVGRNASKSKSAKEASNRDKLEALGAVFLSTYESINIKPSPSD